MNVCIFVVAACVLLSWAAKRGLKCALMFKQVKKCCRHV